jgi:hypothetical protein
MLHVRISTAGRDWPSIAKGQMSRGKQRGGSADEHKSSVAPSGGSVESPLPELRSKPQGTIAPLGGNGAAITKSTNGVPATNEATAMIQSGAADEHKLAVAMHDGKWTLAATGTTAGLVLSVAVLLGLLAMNDTAKILGVAIVLAFIAGGAAVSLVMHGRLRDVHRHLAHANREIDRKAEENTYLLRRILEKPGSSDPAKQADTNLVQPPVKKRGKDGQPR